MLMTSAAAEKAKAADNRYKYLDRALARHQFRGDALIEVLHTAQELFGFISREQLLYIARSLKLPPSKVYGVATFYHFFSLEPKGEHTVTLCMGTACYVRGAAELQNTLEHLCGCKMGQTTADGKISLQTARCVGSCGIAPVTVYDNDVIGFDTIEQATERIASWRKEEQ
ncbi:MAG: bidirectional hydrogenase complex protein HoxE [Bacteroidia bacterium]|nr:bidirectional hydrogenase complex protein HoxE [Bacteroidia bacterium]